MNRRTFLKALAATPVVIVLAPLAVEAAAPKIQSGVALSILNQPLCAPRYVWGRISLSDAVFSESSGQWASAFKSELDALTRDMQREMAKQVAFYGVTPEPTINWQKRDGRVWWRTKDASEAMLYWMAS